MKAISIIVPTLNESENIPILLSRIAKTFQSSSVRYEVVFVDDHSTDGTTEVIKSLTGTYPAKLYMKAGPRGKAYSLLEGFKHSKYNVLCMIDADLQYPPEAILPMYELLIDSNIDIALTERVDDDDTSKLRKLSSSIFHFVFTKSLFGFDYDTQSGLKVFRKEVINKVTLNPTPWSFDLEFIVRALEQNYKIISFKIPFSKRLNGNVKVQLVKVAYELAVASIKLRINSSPEKIKHAHQTNMKIAEGILSLFVLSTIGMYTLAATLTTSIVLAADSAIVNTAVEIPSFLLRDDTSKQYTVSNTNQDTATPKNSSQDETVQTAITSERKAMTNVISNINQTETSPPPIPESGNTVFGVSYPKQIASVSYSYSENSTRLTTDLIQIWIAALGSIALVLAAATALSANTQRKRQLSPATTRSR